MLLAAGTVSAAGFLQADTIINTIEKEGRAPINIPEIDRAEAGEAQTMMILGSDQRFGDKKLGIKPRSDTIILVRLDPDKEATAVMSIPRDLKVDIPGYGNDRINAAYELGGPRLDGQDRQAAVRPAGKPFKINHIVNVDFGGFRKVVNYIGGVYVDIDRDYFNDNSGGENFATIDVNPGYQKLKGQDALDYVRYRHGDNDLVRAARQQDFLRQLRNAAGVRKLLDYRRRRQLAKIFARYTDTDKGLRHKKDVFSLLKLVLFTGRKPVREVRFRIDLTDDPVYLTASKSQARPDRERVPQRAGLQEAAPDLARHRGRPQVRPQPQEAQPRGDRAGPRGRPARGRGPGDRRRAARPLPVLLPDAALPRLALRGHRAAHLRHPRRAPQELHRAYRLVVSKGVIGEYYGIQGTTWREPPILDDPSEVRKVNGRKLELHYDGRRLRLVAWRTKRAVYWVSNTLTQSLNTRQMIAIAGVAAPPRPEVGAARGR